MSGSVNGPPTASYMGNPAQMGGLGCFHAWSPCPCFRGGPWGRKRILRKKILGVKFSGGKKEVVCDVVMLSSTFFHEGRVDSGLDSCDSSRSGLGLSPVGRCRLPLKVQGH